jgi:hypothetical protein
MWQRIGVLAVLQWVPLQLLQYLSGWRVVSGLFM